MMKRSLRAASQRLTSRPLSSSSVYIPPPVQITTLPNKVRVATESTPGHFGALGVYVDAGSRYESPRMSGCSHILDRMAWKSTHTRTADSVSEQIDALGGQFLCSSSRETIMYQASHFTHDAPAALSIISDTIQNSLFLPEELDAQRDAAAYEVREVNAKPEMILPEIIHTVAYRDNTLGNPLLCPEERIDQIDGPLLKEFVRTWFRPERMVVAGAGIPHEELVELAQKHFGDISVPAAGPQKVPTHLLNSSKSQQQPSFYKSLTTAATSFLHNPSEPSFSNLAHARANYTGGHVFIPRPDLDLTHMYVAFEGVPIHDPDIYALATMQILLGGGGSFSAGGPGKGMYSRLYTHILNHHPQIDHCAAFHHIYTDSSLFGINTALHPSTTPSQVLPVIAHQFSMLLYKNVPAAELQRAKNQLKSSLVMALESRAVEVEDLGRQVLVHGRKIGVDEMCDKIDNVGPADMRRVAGRVFGESGSRASVIVMGAEDVKDPVGVLKSYGVGKS
ncbi:Mitochondrial processing peptidase [Rhizoctonia solani]|uniref:Mitochondrial processing peptidase n=1 Tax=Rhizoctonia solani TaxID=456999 RepID=A0A8H7HDE6_9AGAM|nr:Mitochondrial processing peptidase [Rhizoctonia solani]